MTKPSGAGAADPANPDAEQPVIVIGGPTASGKSALALYLAEHLDGVVINADAMQVYRELAVITARPDAADLARAPHRLFGTVPAADGCSAAQWRDWAVAEIAAARASRRRPIVVGGSGLYIRALLQGIADIPPIPEDLRAEVRTLLAAEGAPAVHARLAAVDAAAAARLSPNDSQRVARAWEVWCATGRTLSAWQAAPAPAPAFPFRAAVLLPPRTWLYPRCDARFLAMIDAGAVAEVAALLRADPPIGGDAPALRALGVPQLSAHLAGDLSLDAAIQAAQAATRAYAKRQITWFRNQLATEPGVEVIEAQFSSEVGEYFLSKIT